MMGVDLARLFLTLATLSAAPLQELRFDGLGAVRTGMTLAQAEQALGTKLTIEFPNDDGPTGCGIASVEDRADPSSYMIESGRITRVDLGGRGARSAIRTSSGIGIGSRVDEIRRAYGRRAQSHPNAYDETEPVFEIKSGDGKAAIVFETEHGQVVRIHAGRLPSAEYIEGCL